MDVMLNGRGALVCGSTQGIGRAVAETIARQGATVTLARLVTHRPTSVNRGASYSLVAWIVGPGWKRAGRH